MSAWSEKFGDVAGFRSTVPSFVRAVTYLSMLFL